jgi:hypothetical protein
VGIPLLALLAVPSTVLGLGAPALMVSAAAFAGGLGLAVFNTLFETVVQEQIPPHAISRVASIDWMLSNALLPVGFAAAGPLADRFGIASVLLVGAGWLVASSAVMLAIPSIRGMTRRASGE